MFSVFAFAVAALDRVRAFFVGAWGWVALAGGAILTGLVIALKLVSVGRKGAEADLQKDRLDAVKAKKEKEDEVDRLGHADLDQRLQRWVQRDKRD